MGTEYHGPFVETFYKLSVDGYLIPFIVGRKRGDGGEWSLTLDSRFGLDTNEEELARWLPFLSDAMAIAAGYSCFGEHSRVMSRFNNRISGISMDEISSATDEEHHEPYKQS